MIPVRTVMPARTAPAAALMLIGLHAAAWLWMRWAVGAPVTAAPVAVDADVPSLFAAMFVHGDWPRLAADLLCLWLFGENVEDRTGHGRFIGLYLLCGLAAVSGPVAASSESMIRAIGATGAVAGVIGAHLALFPRSRIVLLIPVPSAWTAEIPALVMAAFWATLHFALGVLPALAAGDASVWSTGAPGIIAAMALGAIIIRVLTQRERMRPEWWHDG